MTTTTEFIEVPGFRGYLGRGLAPRQLEATLWSAAQFTAKEIARYMSCSPYTVRQQLDDARFKLGMQRTVRGLCIEAIKRGIIAPLCLVLTLAGPFHQQTQPVRRPEAPRAVQMVRVQRIEFTYLAA